MPAVDAKELLLRFTARFVLFEVQAIVGGTLSTLSFLPDMGAFVGGCLGIPASLLFSTLHYRKDIVHVAATSTVLLIVILVVHAVLGLGNPFLVYVTVVVVFVLLAACLPDEIRRTIPGCCTQCDYNLAGLEPEHELITCPECGHLNLPRRSESLTTTSGRNRAQ
ncbi:MAG: hypothetical protein IID31_03150 [Planctomycetes bacterium]|nr:hypothetical protein [Planctomycetota bacterium]